MGSCCNVSDKATDSECLVPSTQGGQAIHN
jgi:hypothetical protein